MARKNFRKNLFDEMLSVPGTTNAQSSDPEGSVHSPGVVLPAGETLSSSAERAETGQLSSENTGADRRKSVQTDIQTPVKPDRHTDEQTDGRKSLQTENRNSNMTARRNYAKPKNQNSVLTDVRLAGISDSPISAQADFQNSVLTDERITALPDRRTDGRTDLRQDSAVTVPDTSGLEKDDVDEPAEPGNLNRTKVTFWVRSNLVKGLKHLSVDQDRLLSDLANEALSDLLAKYGK